MYIPKSLVTIVVLVGALAIGWLSHDLVGQLASELTGGSLGASGVAAAPDDQQVSASAEPVATNVYLTIVNSPTGTTATVPAVAPVKTTLPAPSRVAPATTVRAPAVKNWRMPAQRLGGTSTLPRPAGAPSTGTHGQDVGGGPLPEPDYEFPTGSLVVGGDGIDDLSLRVDGVGNVSTYDDSNVVIGGSGAVNAQIGDSDTGGTVTMDTVDGTVSGGNSR